VFAFFAEARNLEAITPPFLRFEILPPVPERLAQGSRIDYRLSLFGWRFGWRTEIAAWEQGSRFVDVQLRGPYSLWRHEHAFEDADGGTRVRDRVEYGLPLGPVGELAHALAVRRILGRIFDYRRDRVASLLGAPGAARSRAL